MKHWLSTIKGLFQPKETEGWEIAEVTLYVLNLHAMKRFYTRVLGLSIFQDLGTELLLGLPQGKVPLIRLVQVKKTPGQLMQSRTYAIGIELPKRHQLADLLNTLVAEEQAILASADDGYSEAFYIMDPEQNRLKFYSRKPNLLEHDPAGQLHEGTSMQLSLQALMELGDLTEPTLPMQALSLIHI